MLDFLFAIGQVLSTLLYLYGAYLVIRHTWLSPEREARPRDEPDPLLLMERSRQKG